MRTMRTKTDEDLLSLMRFGIKIIIENKMLRQAWQDFRHDMQILPYNSGECSSYNEYDIWDLISKYDAKFKEGEDA